MTFEGPFQPKVFYDSTTQDNFSLELGPSLAQPFSHKAP